MDSKNAIGVPFFTGYSYSGDEKKLLLETDVDRIYRHSKLAHYYVYDLATKKANLLFGEKVQEPRFLPMDLKLLLSMAETYT